MVEHLLGRKGASRIALIPPEVLEALNDGLLETVNLNEFLALDLPRLARSVARAHRPRPGSRAPDRHLRHAGRLQADASATAMSRAPSTT